MHLDHCTDPAFVKACIDLGWSSVMIDMSKAPFEENVRITGEIVALANERDVTVEGELGAIVGVEEEIVVAEHQAGLASPEASEEFVKRTGVGAFAPAIGTAHGLYKGAPDVKFGLFEDHPLAYKLPAGGARRYRAFGRVVPKADFSGRGQDQHFHRAQDRVLPGHARIYGRQSL